jgi:hypothetical protein
MPLYFSYTGAVDEIIVLTSDRALCLQAVHKIIITAIPTCTNRVKINRELLSTSMLQGYLSMVIQQSLDIVVQGRYNPRIEAKINTMVS